MDEYEKNVSTKVFTEQEEVSLLQQIIEDRQSLCMCISCSMNDLKYLAYQVVRKKKKPYPKSWNKNQQTNSEWLKKFEVRHRDKITNLFSPICNAEVIQVLTSKQHFSSNEILTFEEEQALLAHIQMRTDCICKNCIMKEVTVEAYKVVHDMEKYYPKSWDLNKQVGHDWLEGFEMRHRDEMLKLLPTCEAELSQEMTNQQQSSYREIFTWKEEQALLKEIQIIAETGYCNCISCSLEELKWLAYETALEMMKPYPKSWDKNQCAGYKWLNEFVTRHNSELSKFSHFCKIT